MLVQKCRHVKCDNDAHSYLEVGSLKLPTCKLHLDMVNGYVDLDGAEVQGVVTRPGIRVFAGSFVLELPPMFKKEDKCPN